MSQAGGVGAAGVDDISASVASRPAARLQSGGLSRRFPARGLRLVRERRG